MIPKFIQSDMKRFAYIAATLGWILRSGGACGSDIAFEDGCDRACGLKEIFLPWAMFNDNVSSFITPSVEAHDLARRIHPSYSKLGPAAKLLLARNMHQILGPSLDTPVRFVICYTQDSCEHYSNYTATTGGTGSAIALASKYFIPVFNIHNEHRFFDAIDFLTNINSEVFTL